MQVLVLDEADLLLSYGISNCAQFQYFELSDLPCCPSKQVLVLDEADLLLSYGYEEDVQQLAPQVGEEALPLLKFVVHLTLEERATQKMKARSGRVRWAGGVKAPGRQAQQPACEAHRACRHARGQSIGCVSGRERSRPLARLGSPSQSAIAPYRPCTTPASRLCHQNNRCAGSSVSAAWTL